MFHYSGKSGHINCVLGFCFFELCVEVLFIAVTKFLGKKLKGGRTCLVDVVGWLTAVAGGEAECPGSRREAERGAERGQDRQGPQDRHIGQTWLQ
jgi:hypothetical protein